jgi:hypothetical protein
MPKNAAPLKKGAPRHAFFERMTRMSISPARWLLALACLALLMCGVRTESAFAAKKKPAKSWPGKKKHPHKKHAPAAGPAKSGGAAPPYY